MCSVYVNLLFSGKTGAELGMKQIYTQTSPGMSEIGMLVTADVLK